MRPPTPATISIIITLSWSVSSVKPNRYWPADSQVHEVVVCVRWSGLSPRSRMNATTAARNEPKVVAVEIKPAARRESAFPPSVIAIVEASGSSRQTQATAFIALTPQRPQLVDVEVDVAPAHRHDEAEADHDFGRRDRHHGDREDL